jgi:actin-related protein 5
MLCGLSTISVKLERSCTPLGTIPNMDEDSDNATTVPNLLHFQPMEPDVYNTPHTTPIIIDNGCTTYRFGFSDASSPYSVANIYSRYRERKHNLQIALFGDNVEVESGAKTQSKTAWEGDILINFDAMENALDYAFCKLGLDTDSVMHPVLVSERLCTPMYSRSGMLAFHLPLKRYIESILFQCSVSCYSKATISQKLRFLSMHSCRSTTIPPISHRGTGLF